MFSFKATHTTAKTRTPRSRRPTGGVTSDSELRCQRRRLGFIARHCDGGHIANSGPVIGQWRSSLHRGFVGAPRL